MRRPVRTSGLTPLEGLLRHPRYAAPRPAQTRAARLHEERTALIDAVHEARHASEQLRLENQQLRHALKHERQLRDQLDAALSHAREQIASHDSRESEPADALRADLANLRRQQERSTALAVHQARTELLSPVADTLDALDNAVRHSDDPDGPWHAGITQLTHQLRDVLAKQGVTVLGAVGERFDPTRHEAVGVLEGGEVDQIIAVQSHGLVAADGTLLRPARVIVSKGVHHV